MTVNVLFTSSTSCQSSVTRSRPHPNPPVRLTSCPLSVQGRRSQRSKSRRWSFLFMNHHQRIWPARVTTRQHPSRRLRTRWMTGCRTPELQRRRCYLISYISWLVHTTVDTTSGPKYPLAADQTEVNHRCDRLLDDVSLCVYVSAYSMDGGWAQPPQQVNG